MLRSHSVAVRRIHLETVTGIEKAMPMPTMIGVHMNDAGECSNSLPDQGDCAGPVVFGRALPRRREMRVMIASDTVESFACGELALIQHHRAGG